MTEQNAFNPTALKPIDKRRARVRWIAKTGIISAVAIVLMYLEIPMPFMPSFLKFDFSEVAVLLAAFAMGPFTGILVELIKNLAHLPQDIPVTMGVGSLANFLVGAFFVGVAAAIYRHRKTRGTALLGMLFGILIMTAAASLINYFFLIPFYINVVGFPLEAIVQMTAATGNTMVTDLPSLIVWVFVPFNLFKGIVVSLVVALIYKRISPLLHR